MSSNKGNDNFRGGTADNPPTTPQPPIGARGAPTALVVLIKDAITAHGEPAVRAAMKTAKEEIAAERKAAPSKRGPSAERSNAKAERDRLIASLWKRHYPDHSATSAAILIARGFAHYHDTHWRHDKTAGRCDSPDDMIRTYFKALSLDLKPLAASTIGNLLSKFPHS